MKSTVVKVFVGFLIGTVSVGGFAVANTPSVPVVKACMDNKSKALFVSTNGSCAKGRTAIDIGATGANVKSIAQLVSPSVVSLEVNSAAGGGTGSGSIIRTTSTISYIVTNNHVIEDAANGGTIEVELNNGEVLAGTIVGRDSEYDLAVVSVRKGNLPVIAQGDSSAVSIGDAVVAFGSPLGLSGTVTSGIVSALNRPVTVGSGNIASYIDAIQTDAAINQGNSGGGTGYGNRGGVSAKAYGAYNVSSVSGGGGGGAGGAGGDRYTAALRTSGGAGGVGLSTWSTWGAATTSGQNISGTYWFAGGGGAASSQGGGGAGGNGGGGTGGAAYGTLNTSGTANTGGGGGAYRNHGDELPGNGGSGIVIVRYAV